ncbi:MAG: type I-MYXAN CRISPR-associated protein Cas6/Cmx6 [Gammaproteobacteria bacterium]|nr:MAG: type I-MYXAN CRISPR-associated protein Cas6/Cmx6 [Gammaproteobacteria bacterium]
MYWKEPQEKPVEASERMVDVLFTISCRVLPLDHAHALSQAILGALPWLEGEEGGIHLIHGAESGNGWYRPETPDALLYPSRRTRMSLRLPKGRVEDAKALSGKTLDIGGHALTVGKPSVKPLKPSGTLFSRYVVDLGKDEDTFLEDVAREIEAMGISVNKLLCGKPHLLRFPEGALSTRSLMVADLRPEDSVRLQEKGLGTWQKQGCGLLVAYKDIKPVKTD